MALFHLGLIATIAISLTATLDIVVFILFHVLEVTSRHAFVAALQYIDFIIAVKTWMRIKFGLLQKSITHQPRFSLCDELQDIQRTIMEIFPCDSIYSGNTSCPNDCFISQTIFRDRMKIFPITLDNNGSASSAVDKQKIYSIASCAC